MLLNETMDAKSTVDKGKHLYTIRFLQTTLKTDVDLVYLPKTR